MKYIRKAIVIILAAVFIAAVAIGLSVIFAVRNINVFRIDYQTGDSSPSEEFTGALSHRQRACASPRTRAHRKNYLHRGTAPPHTLRRER